MVPTCECFPEAVQFPLTTDSVVLAGGFFAAHHTLAAPAVQASRNAIWELHPDKTRRIEFGRFAEQNRERRGEGKPETFDFLGFTHISGKNGLGRFMVRRTTIRKRMRGKPRQIQQQLRMRMHDPLPQTGRWLRSVVQGHFNYYAVPGNLASLGAFRDRVLAQCWRTLRRRSQRHRASWTRILTLAQRW